MSNKRKLVFVGGGHAHLHALKRTAEFTGRGYEVILVNPEPHLHYSGMATGVISGTYSPEDYRIDVRRLVERGGGRFVAGRVAEIQTAGNSVLLESGGRISYDALSLCTGSGVPLVPEMQGEEVYPIKPVANLQRFRERALRFGGRPRVVVAGGGPAGCEVAANLAATSGWKGEITLLESEDSLLPDSPRRAGRIVGGLLARRGVKVRLGSPVVAVGDGRVRLSGGDELNYDLFVPAVGVVPGGLPKRSELLTARDGSLWVDRFLRSVSDPRIFGGGDAIGYRGEPLPRLGVFAVRQGPVLYRNLLATLGGLELEEYRPQRRYLYVLNLGDGTGLAIYGAFVARGRWAWWIKDRIDRRFIAESR